MTHIATRPVAGRINPTAILAIILISYFMILLDNSIIFTGLPSIQSRHGLLGNRAVLGPGRLHPGVRRASPAGCSSRGHLRPSSRIRGRSRDFRDCVVSRRGRAERLVAHRSARSPRRRSRSGGPGVAVTADRQLPARPGANARCCLVRRCCGNRRQPRTRDRRRPCRLGVLARRLFHQRSDRYRDDRSRSPVHSGNRAQLRTFRCGRRCSRHTRDDRARLRHRQLGRSGVDLTDHRCDTGGRGDTTDLALPQRSESGAADHATEVVP